MRRSEFSIGVGTASLIIASSPEILASSPWPYHASDGYRPRKSGGLLPFGAKSPFAYASATTKIPVEKTFGPPRFFSLDTDSGEVKALGQTKAQRQAEYEAMHPKSTDTLYVTAEVLYVNASSYFANRKKEIIQVKPTVTQVKELPELTTNQQTLSWSAVLKVELSDNVTGQMLHTSIDSQALTSLRRMPIVNGIGLFSIPYTGTATKLNGALVKIDDALSTLNSLGKIAGGIPGILINAATIGAFSTAQSVVDQLVVLFGQGRARNEEAFSGDSVMFAVMQAPAVLNDPLVVRVPQGGQNYILVPGGDPASGETPQSDDFIKAVAGKKVTPSSSGRLSVSGEPDNYLDMFNYATINLAVET